MGTLKWQIAEFAGDILDPVLDASLSNPLLQAIPVVGSFVKAAQLGASVSDRIFLAKVRALLDPLVEIGADDTERFRERMEADPKLAQRTGQVLLLALDELNDLEKARVLALIFRAYLKDEISLDTLQRLCSAVSLALVSDLWTLAEVHEKTGTDDDFHRRQLVVQALRITGLTALSDSAFALVGKRSFISTVLTPLGDTLVQILRNESDLMHDRA